MIKIDKIFGDKKGGSVIYILLAVGILMLVMASSFGKSTDVTPPTGSKDALSQRAEEILSQIKGVGNVSVMISYKKGEKQQAFFFEEEGGSDKVESVLIVADGGKNNVIREKIVRAAMAALGVEAHKIEVFERKEKQ